MVQINKFSSQKVPMGRSNRRTIRCTFDVSLDQLPPLWELEWKSSLQVDLLPLDVIESSRRVSSLRAADDRASVNLSCVLDLIARILNPQFLYHILKPSAVTLWCWIVTRTASASGFTPFSISETQYERDWRSSWVFCPSFNYTRHPGQREKYVLAEC